jgi:anaerobic magnesium-protoporphyrin IX monomethyl ester cyclase
MKILLLNPPFLKKFSRSQRSPAVTKSGTIYFPMWLSYAAGVLMKNGFEVELIDAPADGYSIDDTIAKAVKFQPRLIIMETSTPSIYNDAAVAGDLKEICPSSFIVLVGTHVSALPDETLNINKGVDAIARHEYDYTLLDLARTLEKGGDLNNVKGISFRSGKGITHIPDRSYIENLDELPFVSKVYKKFLKVENYFNPNALYPMVTITTSRGCPFQCIFCVYPQTMMGHKLRLRSVENVVEEIEYIIRSFDGVKSIFFEDDTFTTIKKRCIEISNEILKRDIRISWTANARADLDYETMKIMRKAGCRSLCVGFESGGQIILDTMKKNIKFEKMFEFMKNAKQARILIHGCFMVGFPNETRETMKQTLELAKRLNPDTVQFYPMMVYPGTEAYNWYKERGLLLTNDFSKWLTPKGLHNTVIRTEELSSEDLVKFCDDARRSFYLRPKYILYKSGQMMKHPREIKRTMKSLKTFSKYLLKGSDIQKS